MRDVIIKWLTSASVAAFAVGALKPQLMGDEKDYDLVALGISLIFFASALVLAYLEGKK